MTLFCKTLENGKSHVASLNGDGSATRVSADMTTREALILAARHNSKAARDIQPAPAPRAEIVARIEVEFSNGSRQSFQAAIPSGGWLWTLGNYDGAAWNNRCWLCDVVSAKNL